MIDEYKKNFEIGDEKVPSIVGKGVVDRLVAALSAQQTKMKNRALLIEEINEYNKFVSSSLNTSNMILKRVPSAIKFNLKKRKKIELTENILLDSRTIGLDKNGNLFSFYKYHYIKALTYMFFHSISLGFIVCQYFHVDEYTFTLWPKAKECYRLGEVHIYLRKHAEKRLLGKGYPLKRPDNYKRPPINSSDGDWIKRSSEYATLRNHPFALNEKFCHIPPDGAHKGVWILKHGASLYKEYGRWYLIVHYLRQPEVNFKNNKFNPAPYARGLAVAVDPGINVVASPFSSDGPRTKEEVESNTRVGFLASIGKNTTELLNSRIYLHGKRKNKAYWSPNAPDGLDLLQTRNFQIKGKKIKSKKLRRMRKKKEKKDNIAAANKKEDASEEKGKDVKDKKKSGENVVINLSEEKEIEVYDLEIGLSAADIEEINKCKTAAEKKKRRGELAKQRKKDEDKAKEILFRSIKEKKHKKRKDKRKK